MQIAFFYLVPALFCFLGGLFYFTMEPRTSTFARAFLVSLYGPAVGALNFYTGLQAGSPRTHEIRELMFLSCAVVPPVLFAASMLLYRGPKWVHAFILPAGFCYLQMLVTGQFVYLDART